MQTSTKKGEQRMETQFYKQKINELVEKIENQEILKLIYGFAKSGYKEEKAGRK